MPNEKLMEVLIEQIKGLSNKIDSHTEIMGSLPCQVNSTKLEILWKGSWLVVVAVVLFFLNKILTLVA